MKEKAKQTKIDRIANVFRKKTRKPKGQAQGESTPIGSENQSEVDNSNLIQVGGINDFHEEIQKEWIRQLEYSIKNDP